VRLGTRLGIDVGKVRIGVARSDPHGILATPVVTVARGEGDLTEIVRLAAEFDVVEVVVGSPLALSGRATASTQDALDFAARVASAIPVPVRLVDERLSTVSAQRAMRSSGRTVRSSRPVIDQVAAVIILQHALDLERASGAAPGTLLAPDERR
jgi:putative holliday junction resolvase